MKQVAGTHATLLQNARVFDGTSEELSLPTSVLMEGNKINGKV